MPISSPALAPFRLAPYFRTRPWGFHDLAPWFDYKTDGEPIGEVWLTGEMCTAATGPLRGKTLTEITQQHGPALLGTTDQRDFPLLVKILFPKEKLSVQVHPDDALAQQYGEPRGKTECWYALDAEPGASVALGLRPGTTKEQVEAAIANHTLESLLEMVPMQKGDMVFVAAGTVHAIGPGVVILETQQTSDLTYRMYDYGSARELHLEKAMAATRLQTRAGKIPPRKVDGHSVLIEEQYFRVEQWPVTAETAPLLAAPSEAVQMLFVQSGQLQICPSAPNAAAFEPFVVQQNQLAVIPSVTASWSLKNNAPTEVIRILPARG